MSVGTTHASFEPSAPLRDRAGGFEAMPVAGRTFAPDAASSPVPPAPAAPTPAEIEARERAAFERGVAEGRAALPWQEAAALEAALGALEQAARKVAALRRSYLIENRRAVIDLACGIARSIVGAAGVDRGPLLEVLLERALAEAAPTDAPVEVRVAPADLDALARARGDSDGTLRFAPDAALPPGEVRVATRTGDVRASLAVAIERIRTGLEDALGAPEPEAASR
jgi:flagellar biosynthesis/type III secretory pathway protein FliH